MRFRNDTGLPAKLFRGEPKPGQMLATLVLKTTHEVEFGELGPVLLEGSEPSPRAVETELGVIPSDRVPYKPGLDVWVHGHATAPGDEPTPAMVVRLQVGDEHRELLVIGDRTWLGPDLHSEPEPFTTMPLTYARAFGGRAETDAEPIPYVDNPDGRGYVWEAKRVKGVALPNLEWPNQRIRRWDDRPQPAGFAPLAEGAGMQIRRSMDVGKTVEARPKFRPGVFSAAHPKLVMPFVQPGTAVRLQGMGDRLEFNVPYPGMHAVIELGNQCWRMPLRLDTIGIFADEQKVQLVRRASFRYELVAHQHRRVMLEPGDLDEEAA